MKKQILGNSIRRALLPCLTGGMLLGAGSVYANVLIDNFEDDLQVADIDADANPDSGQVTDGGSNMMSPERDMEINMTSGSVSVTGTTTVTQGQFQCTEDSFDDGTCLLQWDAADADTGADTSLTKTLMASSVDLSEGGANDQFGVQVTGHNGAAFTLTFTATDSGGSTYTGTISNVNGVGDYFVTFASFSPAYDFTDVSALELLFDNGAATGGGIRVQFIETHEGPTAVELASTSETDNADGTKTVRWTTSMDTSEKFELWACQKVGTVDSTGQADSYQVTYDLNTLDGHVVHLLQDIENSGASGLHYFSNGAAHKVCSQ